jgi:ankyrin repeat protein
VCDLIYVACHTHYSANGQALDALQVACSEGHLGAALAVLESGAVGASQLTLTAAVHCADETVGLKLCKALLARGAAVDAVSSTRESESIRATPLAHAAATGKAAVGTALLKAGTRDTDTIAYCYDIQLCTYAYSVKKE